jgi:hypothetical protein
MRATLVQAAAKAGRRKLGYVVQHGEDLVAAKAARFSREVADAARAGVPQDPTYDDDRMLIRLIRDALFHRDSERRHLGCCSSRPHRSARLPRTSCGCARGENIYPVMRARMALLIWYLSNDSHGLRMLAFVDDKSDDVAPFVLQLGHRSYSTISDQAISNGLGKTCSPRERAKMYALGISGSPGLLAIANVKDAPAWRKAGARWWLEPVPAMTS